MLEEGGCLARRQLQQVDAQGRGAVLLLNQDCTLIGGPVPGLRAAFADLLRIASRGGDKKPNGIAVGLLTIDDPGSGSADKRVTLGGASGGNGGFDAAAQIL